MKRIFCKYTAALTVVLAMAGHCQAQSMNSVWSEPGKQTQAARKKVQGTADKIKKFKKHLEQWGLDSNYNHGIAVGARLNSNGWTGLVTYQHRRNRTQLDVVQLSFSEVKHEKEAKQQRQNTQFPELGNGTPFNFGKINNAYQVQLGYGREYLLLPGVLEGNLSIGLRIQGGLSVAMLKPYYLKLIYVDYSQTPATATVQDERYSETNADKFLTPSMVLGESKWKEGLDEIKWLPGLYLDGAVTIEPIKNKTFIKAVSLGMNVSMHSGKIEIMADQKAYPWVTSLYICFSLGKRWYGHY